MESTLTVEGLLAFWDIHPELPAINPGHVYGDIDLPTLLVFRWQRGGRAPLSHSDYERDRGYAKAAITAAASGSLERRLEFIDAAQHLVNWQRNHPDRLPLS